MDVLRNLAIALMFKKPTEFLVFSGISISANQILAWNIRSDVKKTKKEDFFESRKSKILFWCIESLTAIIMVNLICRCY